MPNVKRLSDASHKASQHEQRSWRQINLVGLNRRPRGGAVVRQRGMLGGQPRRAVSIMGAGAPSGALHRADSARHCPQRCGWCTGIAPGGGLADRGATAGPRSPGQRRQTPVDTARLMAALYGCLPAMSSNPHRCVKKSAAALYPACGVGAGLPSGPLAPM